MSVSSHFGPNQPQPRMPADHNSQTEANATGIKWSGRVLEGQLSTTEAFALDRLATALPQNHNFSGVATPPVPYVPIGTPVWSTRRDNK